MTSELIPFHALPIYKESTDFTLTDDEKSVIVDGEFRKALSKQGNAISKSAEILDDESIVFTIEAGNILSWKKYLGNNGVSLGIDGFGESAPYKKVYEHLNLSVEKIVTLIQDRIRK